jgi:dihydroxy-acid dehydratase
MSDNFRSQVVTQGVQRSPNRAMLRAVGFGDRDFTKPIVGIANGYSTITPAIWGWMAWQNGQRRELKRRGYASDVRHDYD